MTTPIKIEQVSVTQADIDLGQQVWRDFMQNVGADNNPGEYEGEWCAIEAACRARIAAETKTREEDARIAEEYVSKRNAWHTPAAGTAINISTAIRSRIPETDNGR